MRQRSYQHYQRALCAEKHLQKMRSVQARERLLAFLICRCAISE